MASTTRPTKSKNPTKQAQVTKGGASATSLATRRLGPLYLFRKAVLNDRKLQDRLRSASGCTRVAEIATEYLRTHIKITVSHELETSALRDAAEMVFQNVFQITDEELGAYLEANTNEEGEFMLGQDELAMVAGSARLSDTNTCSYGSGCGSCQCSSSLACVCK